MFSWPNGIVIGNLIASAILGVPVVVRFERKLERQHREHMERLGEK